MVESQSISLQSRNFRIGLLYLLANLVVSVCAQLMLKKGMLELGAFELAGGGSYLLEMLHPLVVGGLILYACGTVLWLLCLTKLDLSFAYPVGTLQYLLVFAGAWLWFGEEISLMRLLGLGVICVGVLFLALDRKES